MATGISLPAPLADTPAIRRADVAPKAAIAAALMVAQRFQQLRHAHPAPELLDQWHGNLETQVNGRHGKTRIGPATAKPIDYSLDGAKIGSSGWNYVESRSEYVGFDFDDLQDHSGTGIAPESLEAIKTAVSGLDYVEIRRSTRGKGWHLRVRLVGVETFDRAEHAAVARAVLAKIADDCGVDLSVSVDACGLILWIVSPDMTPDGYQLVKAASRSLNESEIPNWQAHVEVIRRKRSKVRIGDLPDELADDLEFRISAWSRVPLDAAHRSHIEFLRNSGFSVDWVPDHWCLRAHTCAFAALFAGGKIKGVYQTTSPGSDPGSTNCFAFPLKDGGWRIIRRGNPPEAPTWTRDSHVSCVFNQAPDLAAAAAANGGAEDPDSGDYVLAADGADATIKLLGGALEIPKGFREREIELKVIGDNRLKVSMAAQSNEAGPAGWVLRKKKWTSAVTVVLPRQSKANSDNVLRALMDSAGNSAGIFARSKAGTWDRHDAGRAKMILQSLGQDKPQAERSIGDALRERWELVSLPFQAEFPGGRRWNLGAAQLRGQPEDGDHPTWEIVIKHIAESLTTAVEENDWCRENGITTGAEWLTLWIACVIRRPFDQLPYLFLHGAENGGKSILWEAISLLVTRGVVSADRALTNPQGYNGEFLGAILAVVEEVNVAESKHARDRLKSWVTCKSLAIRAMRTDVFHVPSTLHFIQCANNRKYVPVFPGDSRIVVCHVPKPREPIAKDELLRRLEAEAPQFLASLYRLRIPDPDGRLRIAVLETTDKQEQAEENEPISRFLRERCRAANVKTAVDTIIAAYNAWAEENEEEHVSRGDRAAFSAKLRDLADFKIELRQKTKEDENGKRFNAYGGIELCPASPAIPA